MKMKIIIACVILASVLLVGPATATVIYSNDFESGSSLGFTGDNSIVTSPDGHSFLGVLAQGAKADLVLSGLAPHDSVTLSFDLYGLFSLDGDNDQETYGPDYFIVNLNGSELMKEEIGWWYDGSDGATHPGYVSNDPNGFGWGSYFGGVLTFNYTFDIVHSNPDISFAFIGACNQPWQEGWYDEGFGVDNVVVSSYAKSVPEPASMLLLGLGLIGVAGFRRKFKS